MNRYVGSLYWMGPSISPVQWEPIERIGQCQFHSSVAGLYRLRARHRRRGHEGADCGCWCRALASKKGKGDVGAKAVVFRGTLSGDFSRRERMATLFESYSDGVNLSSSATGASSSGAQVVGRVEGLNAGAADVDEDRAVEEEGCDADEAAGRWLA